MRRILVLSAAALMLASCQTLAPKPKTVAVQVRCFLESNAIDATPLVLPQSGVRIAVDPQSLLTQTDLIDAELAQMELGAGLMLRLTPDATRRFAEATANAVGRRLVLTTDGAAIAARRIEAPITNGLLFFFVEMRESELSQLVSHLQHGAARRPPSQSSIGR